MTVAGLLGTKEKMFRKDKIKFDFHPIRSFNFYPSNNIFELSA